MSRLPESAAAVLGGPRLPPELVHGVAAVPFAIAVLVIVVGVVRVLSSGRAGPSELAAAVALGLEFLLAAGLVRLAAIDDFAALGMVALVIVVRKVVGVGIRSAVRALGSGPPGEIRA